MSLGNKDKNYSKNP